MIGRFLLGAGLGALVGSGLLAIVSVVALTIVKAVVGLRVTEAAEREGLDITTHGERAYN